MQRGGGVGVWKLAAACAALAGCFSPSGGGGSTETTGGSTTGGPTTGGPTTGGPTSDATTVETAGSATVDPEVTSTGPGPTTGGSTTTSTGPVDSDATTTTGDVSTVEPMMTTSASDTTTTTDTTDTSTTTAMMSDTSMDPVCGDGVVQAGEACDAGPNSVACSPQCERTARYVFVTDQMFLAPAVAVATVDALCTELAPTLNGFAERPYVAWLSDSQTGVLERMFATDLPFVLYNDMMVADGYEAFIGGAHAIPINLTQSMVTVGNAAANCDADAGGRVWTGTDVGGAIIPTDTCLDWVSVAVANTGAVGRAGMSGGAWTNACAATCDKTARLYCVENF